MCMYGINNHLTHTQQETKPKRSSIFIIVCIFRERGRGGERDRDTHQWVMVYVLCITYLFPHQWVMVYVLCTTYLLLHHESTNKSSSCTLVTLVSLKHNTLMVCNVK